MSTILVVEDEPQIRELAVEVLRDAGHCVLEAARGCEAILLFEERPEIDLIFTDIVMPGIDGFKVADMAKVRRPEVKILYVTGFEHRTRNFLGIVHGRILRKPYRQSDLLQAVEEALVSNDVPASSTDSSRDRGLCRDR
jgi:CheY-like chemotaxis protein